MILSQRKCVVELDKIYELRALDFDFNFSNSEEFVFLAPDGQNYPTMTHYLATRQLRHDSEKSLVEATNDPYTIRQRLMMLGFNLTNNPFVYKSMSVEEIEIITEAIGHLIKQNKSLASSLVALDRSIFVKNMGPIVGPNNLYYGAVLVAGVWTGINVIGKVITLYHNGLKKGYNSDWDSFICNSIIIMREWYEEHKFSV